MADEAKWYVVHTYSGYENKVASNLEKVVENRQLQDLIKEIRVPTETVTEIREDGKRKEVERKIFPGYVLIKMIMTDETWYIIRNTTGVTGFVGPGSKPVALTEEEVAALGVDIKEITVDYQVGDSVKITSGPFANQIGIVDEIDLTTGKVKVNVVLFGRKTVLELDYTQAETM